MTCNYCYNIPQYLSWVHCALIKMLCLQTLSFRGENGPGGYKMISVDNNNTQLVWLCDTDLKVRLLVFIVMLTCLFLGLVSTVPHRPNPCYHDDTDTPKA